MNVLEFLQQFALDEFDSQVLLAHCLGRSRTWLLAHFDTQLTPPQLDSAQRAFDQLQAGVPLPYILGRWEFFGLEFNLTPSVLIPRPETELLVEKAIRWLKAHPSAHNVADIGTGSGAIAVSIAVNVANAKILATDISPKALHIAKENALKNKVEKQIDFVECDLLPRPQFKSQRSDLQPATFDVICANLPYIPTNTLYNLEIYQKEPTLALDGGADGLEIYRKLFSILPPYLAPKHLILCEIEASQGASAARLAERFFPNARINVHPDLAGHDRLLEIDNEN